MIGRLLSGFAALLCLVAMGGTASAQEDPTDALPRHVRHQTIYAPDYFGNKIVRTIIDQIHSPATYTQTTLSVAARSCNPNSVAVLGAHLYVVCNSDFGNRDQVLVYNLKTFAYEAAITGRGTDGFAYFSGASLIGVVIDAHKNLWVSGYNSNSLYRIPASQLATASPKVDRQVVDSPDSPAGMTLGAGGAIWVVGQYSSGILVEFKDATLNVSGTYLHNSPLNANPTYCLSNTLAGCNPTAGLFDNPEGVAVFGGAVWVSNNGGNAPGRTLVRAAVKTGGGFSTATYGGVKNKPFTCPGGLFAPILAGATPQLWVNDEGFDVGHTNCGASAAFQRSQVGRVMAFTNADLVRHRAAPTPEGFPGSNKLFTGSPGFGGVFVELD